VSHWGSRGTESFGSYHRPVTRLEILQPFVEKTVAEYLGIEQVQVWEDGTIPIRSGTTIVNVRLVQGDNPSRPILQVYSPMLSELDSTPELLAKLNEVNGNLTFVRAFWTDRQVILAMELLAESLDKDQVAHAVSLVSLAGDFWDSELSKTFGGKTYFADEPPPANAPPGETAPSANAAGETGADRAAPRAGPGVEDPTAAGYI
jgi:T3SS (YopN, CesT) and YbjN peptide-binding chaperone 1